MRLLASLVGACIAGFIGHFIPFEKLLASGWNNMATHATGVLFALPFVVLICWVLGMDKENIEKVVIAYLVTYAVEGGGTFFGWFLETFLGERIVV